VKLIIKADRIIDGLGKKPIEKAAVLVENGRIKAVDTQAKLSAASEGAEVINAAGGSIVPGFIEAHSHMHCASGADAYDVLMSDDHDTLIMRSAKAVRAALLSGVTTMRDLGSKNEVALPIKRAVQKGVMPGPRLLVAGTPLTTTAGHCWMFGTIADTKEELVTAVRRQVMLGADCIKIMSTGGNFTPRSNTRRAQYSAETLAAAVQDAERLGVRVSAHCHGAEGVRNCVEAGVHNLIHCTWLSADPSKTYDYDVRVVDTMAKKGLYVDPTIALGPRRQEVDPDADVFKHGGGFADMDRRHEILRDMWDRGVKFVTGLDAGMHMGDFGTHAYVPQFMVEKMGISPMDAIVSNTRTTAECLGVLGETGTLQPGKSADIVVVDGDPSKDITMLHRVSTVVGQGRLVKREGKALV